MLLAIDTSTSIMSLALHSGDTLLAECTLTIGRGHSEHLASMIQQMMTQSNVDASDLTAMAVAIGPGSYTGLRIGVSLAKGMAAVNNLPLVGISTLDTIALGQGFYNTRYTLVVVVPAGRGRVISGEYRGKKGRWVAKDKPILQAWDDLLETYEDRIYLTGEITSSGLEAIQVAQESGKSITLIQPAYRLQRAGFLAEEAWRQIRDTTEEHDLSADKVMPVYLKSPG
jgi:tRNA threonylcarbamoyladenosine biosynthesis protein TsaB